MTLTTRAVATRVGRAPDDPAVRTFCGAVVGVVGSTEEDLDTFVERVDVALDLVEQRTHFLD